MGSEKKSLMDYERSHRQNKFLMKFFFCCAIFVEFVAWWLQMEVSGWEHIQFIHSFLEYVGIVLFGLVAAFEIIDGPCERKINELQDAEISKWKAISESKINAIEERQNPRHLSNTVRDARRE